MQNANANANVNTNANANANANTKGKGTGHTGRQSPVKAGRLQNFAPIRGREQGGEGN